MQAFDSTLKQSEITTHPPAWGAVFPMALCVDVLIAAEVLPVSRLPPIAPARGTSTGPA
ncbi:MFS transporter, partial [Pseudomonas syringae]